MTHTAALFATETLPTWVPKSARHYLFHTEVGLSIRAVARGAGCHASTVLRQIRKIENRRDDPLVDEALRRLGSQHLQVPETTYAKGRSVMAQAAHAHDLDFSKISFEDQAFSVLSALCDPSAVLAVAENLDRAVIVKDGVNGSDTADPIDRSVAQAMALKDWISATTTGRIARYRITHDGRLALKNMRGKREASSHGMAEASAGFTHQNGEHSAPPRRIKSASCESPLTILARRKDKDGNPFLSDELVRAGERLREDFEVAQMGPRVSQDWDRFMTAGVQDGLKSEAVAQLAPCDAKDRVLEALRELGPGLSDMALRCCCFQEGMESAEKRMGWSARSGKIVLRIALQRLKRYYDETHGPYGPMIG